MKFEIRRVSFSHKRDIKPCDDATGPYKSEYNNLLYWGIEINSLTELMELVNKEGEIIFDGDIITIYDDYIE